jgi:predicted transcriptional regulator
MLMTKSSEGLTELESVLLDKLKQAGDWQTRQDIANSIGRVRLNPYDVHVLKSLEKRGLIEVRKASIGTVRKQYEYKAK